MTKATISFLLFINAWSFAIAQNSKGTAKADIRLDGLYICKEWRYEEGKMDNAEAAYFKFLPDTVLLFCCNKDPNDRDTTTSADDIYSTVLSQERLNKIMENMEDD